MGKDQKKTNKNQNKTTANDGDVKTFVEAIEHETRREDAKTLLEMMERLTGYQPKMWGPSIIGFGEYHYIYESGREGDMLRHGFSPRKANLALYISGGFKDTPEILERLGKHKLGKSCLYINKLVDVDLKVLEEMIMRDIIYMDEKYPV
jgi:hypothetical protein